ncbi:MAG TPA: nuclear transport factor 2 family protein [Drouetiella sp.]|jgi:ketosteroid isomerase-like protein
MRPSLKTGWQSLAKVLTTIAFIVPILSGCIELQTPLSHTKFKDDQILGFWRAENQQKSTMQLKITAATNGNYQVQQRDNDSERFGTMLAFITHGKRTNYANLIMTHQDKKDAFMPVQYEVTGDKLRIWHADFDRMKEAIDTKTLTGKANETTWGQNMLITSPGADVLKLFDKADGARYFCEELVLTRQPETNTQSKNTDATGNQTSKQVATEEHVGNSPGNCVAETAKLTPSISTEIENTLQSQADAWNAGDLDKFMTAYLKSLDITFVSADGEMRGYEDLAARYRIKYGNSKETMGKLSFSNLQVQPLGDNNALCIGHWLVERADHTKLEGMFTLVLTKVDGTWKIIHDHTSLFPAPAPSK